jgi:hypothetical protein
VTNGVEQKLVVGDSGELQKVHFFTDESLQKSMTTAINNVTEKSVLLNLEKNSTGFNAAIAAKLDGHWSVVAAFKRDDWGYAAGGSVRFRWGA